MFASLISSLITDRDTISIKTNAPRQVELLTHENESGFSVSALSFQEEMPNLPIPEFEVSLYTGKRRVDSVSLMPDGQALGFVTDNDGYTTFKVPAFDTFTNVKVNIQK